MLQISPLFLVILQPIRHIVRHTRVIGMEWIPSPTLAKPTLAKPTSATFLARHGQFWLFARVGGWVGWIRGRLVRERWGSKGREPKEEGTRWGPKGFLAQNFAFFFLLSRHNFLSFFPLLEVSRGILVVFKALPHLCTLRVLGLSCEAPATPCGFCNNIIGISPNDFHAGISALSSPLDLVRSRRAMEKQNRGNEDMIAAREPSQMCLPNQESKLSQRSDGTPPSCTNGDLLDACRREPFPGSSQPHHKATKAVSNNHPASFMMRS